MRTVKGRGAQDGHLDFHPAPETRDAAAMDLLIIYVRSSTTAVAVTWVVVACPAHWSTD